MASDENPEGARIIKTRFVETWEYSLNGSRNMKARLVVMGNQDPEKGIISSFAPTVSREMIMMTITLSSPELGTQFNWRGKGVSPKQKLKKRRIRAATDRSSNRFWGHEAIEESSLWWWKSSEGMVRYPLMNTGNPGPWEIKKRSGNILIQTQRKTWRNNDCSCWWFFVGGNKDFEALMETLQKKIVIGTHIKKSFKFYGLHIITRNNKTVEITLQESKINSIEKMNRVMGPRGRKITSFEKTMIRSRIGSLQWLAVTCRPDLCVMLNSILARVNSTKEQSIISSINTAVDRFHKSKENKLTLV